MTFTIDWENLPICGEPSQLVISPYICVMPPGQPPVNPPVVPPAGPCSKYLRQRDFFTGTAGGHNECIANPEPPTGTVPIPGTLVLCALGLAIMRVVRRRDAD